MTNPPLYRLEENSIFIIGSHNVPINERIQEEELFEYEIRNRQDFIDNLILWISEATKDKLIMKQDLKMLMNLEDDYILSSISTNDYIHINYNKFNSTVSELLELNEYVNKEDNKLIV